MFLWNHEEGFKQILSGGANHNESVVIFKDLATILEKIELIVSSFDPFQYSFHKQRQTTGNSFSSVW